MNHGLSFVENNIYNLWKNSDINEIFPNLYISNYSTSTNKKLLQNLGITHIITTNSFFNPPFPNDFHYHFFQAFDDSQEIISPYFNQCNSLIREILINSKHKILIHCQAGRSRSVSLILAFILQYFTDPNFHWNIKHELIDYYSMTLEDYNKNFEPLIQINDSIYENTIHNNILIVLNLMKNIRNIIKPNDLFLIQIKNWMVDKNFNITNIIKY
jgi:hypothetical protein